MKILYAPAPLLSGRSVDNRSFWLPGELKNEGVLKPNGRWLSVQPDGSYQDRDSSGGLYETLKPDPDLNVLIVKPAATFKIPFVVTDL